MFYHKNFIFTHPISFSHMSLVFQMYTEHSKVKSVLPTVGVLSFFLTQHMLLFALASWLCWWLLDRGQVRSDNHALLSAQCTTLHLFFSYFKPKAWLEILWSDFIFLALFIIAFQSFETTWISITCLHYVLLPPGFASFLNLESGAFSLAHDPRPVFSLAATNWSMC